VLIVVDQIVEAVVYPVARVNTKASASRKIASGIQDLKLGR
jgi:hypothetical protein